MAALWALGIIFIVAGWATAFFASQLIEVEYTEFRDQWLADGRPPVGGRDRGAGPSYWLSGLSGRFVVLQWLMETPTWVRGHGQASQLLRTLRISAAAMFSSMLGLFLVTVFQASR